MVLSSCLHPLERRATGSVPHLGGPGARFSNNLKVPFSHPIAPTAPGSPFGPQHSVTPRWCSESEVGKSHLGIGLAATHPAESMCGHRHTIGAPEYSIAPHWFVLGATRSCGPYTGDTAPGTRCWNATDARNGDTDAGPSLLLLMLVLVVLLQRLSGEDVLAANDADAATPSLYRGHLPSPPCASAVRTRPDAAPGPAPGSMPGRGLLGRGVGRVARPLS